MACCIAEALRRVCSAIHWVKSRSSRMLPHARNLKKFQRAAAQNFLARAQEYRCIFGLLVRQMGYACAGTQRRWFRGQHNESNVLQRQKANAPGGDASTRPRRNQVDGATDAARFGTVEHAAAAEFQPPAATYEKKSAFSECATLLACLLRSPHRLRVILLTFGIATVLIGNMVGQVKLNEWNGSFFDALAQRNVTALLHQLLIFLGIVAALLGFVVAQTWMQQMLKVRLREWLTHHLLNQWLVHGRAYRLGLAGQIGVNPDQRIEQDTRQFTELSAGLGVGLFQATLLLVSFISILWALSNQLVFAFGGLHFSIPGYMVWCAAIYALVGSLLTWRVGRPLIDLNATSMRVRPSFASLWYEQTKALKALRF